MAQAKSRIEVNNTLHINKYKIKSKQDVLSECIIIHWCTKKSYLLQQQKMSPHQKSNSFNIKFYDFYLNIIHFMLIFYNKYLVVVV